MDKQSAENDLQLIREVMERSARYTHFSGVSGLISGLLGLAGCAATYWIDNNLPVGTHDIWYLVIWGTVLVLAMAEDLFFAQRSARTLNQTIWNPATYQVIRAILPGIVIALVLSYAGLHSGLRNSLSAIWALGYGVALCAAGMFSIKEVSRYGVLQLVTGSVVLIFLRDWQYSFYLAAGLSFGLYQMLFGLWISWKRR